MAAFDTAITPTASTPTNTNNTVLFTATDDSSVMVDVANISASALTVRVGITPTGGTLHWKAYDLSVPVGDAVLGLGPWFLQAGDVISVRTSVSSNATFSVTGLRSS